MTTTPRYTRPLHGPPDPDRASSAEMLAVLVVLTTSWQTQAALARLADLSVRRCQMALQDLVVREGQPIISSGDGVRLTGDPAELDAARDRLRHRAREILRRAAALGRVARQFREASSAVPIQVALPLDTDATGAVVAAS